jgi:hypothetical protein
MKPTSAMKLKTGDIVVANSTYRYQFTAGKSYIVREALAYSNGEFIFIKNDDSNRPNGWTSLNFHEPVYIKARLINGD